MSQNEPYHHTPYPDSWELYVDGSSTNERFRAGLILCGPGGFTIQHAITFLFPATNNQTEYEALLVGLRLADTLNLKKLWIHSDSQIVVKQTKGEYIATDPQLEKYQAMVQTYLLQIPKVEPIQINKKDNTRVDILSKLVLNSADLDTFVYFEELTAPSLLGAEVICLDTLPDWRTPFIQYLKHGTLPKDKTNAQQLKSKASKYFMENDVLYRRTFTVPVLKYIGPDESTYCLSEVHEGIYGDHMSAKALAHKIIRQRYYWPTIHSDDV